MTDPTPESGTQPVPAPDSRKSLWIGAGAAAALLIIAVVFLASRLRPTVFVQWFDYSSDRAGNIHADILLGVRNDAPFDVEISSIDIDLNVDGKQLYKNTSNRVMPMPHGEVVPFPISLNTSEEFVRRFLGTDQVSSPNPSDLENRRIPYDLKIKVQMTRPIQREFMLHFTDAIPSFRMPDIAIAPGGFRIRKFDLFRPELTLQIEVHNPNKFDVVVKNLEFDVNVYGRPISHVKPDVVIEIPAGKSDVVDFNFGVDTMKLGLGGITTFFRGAVDLEIQGAFHGQTPFGTFPVRFEKQATVALTR